MSHRRPYKPPCQRLDPYSSRSPANTQAPPAPQGDRPTYRECGTPGLHLGTDRHVLEARTRQTGSWYRKRQKEIRQASNGKRSGLGAGKATDTQNRKGIVLSIDSRRDIVLEYQGMVSHFALQSTRSITTIRIPCFPKVSENQADGSPTVLQKGVRTL